MNWHRVLVVLMTGSVAGCGETDRAPAESAGEPASPQAAVSVDIPEIWESEAFIEHMHQHADKLDELNFALADDDLDSARSAANWLATHDTDADIQSEWMPYLYAMRTEAEAVEAAPDIASAQVAAERITARCQECHSAVGVSIR